MIPLPAIPPAILARVLAVALVLAATFATGYIHGLRSEAHKFNDYVAAQAITAARVIVKQGDVTERVVTRFVQTQGETKVITQVIEKEIIKYAEIHGSGACLDPDWVRLHNDAAANALSGAPSGPY